VTVRSSYFDFDTVGRRLWPKEIREELGIRSPRTLDAYVKIAGFPKGRLEHFGRIEVRTWSPAELGQAQVWLAARRRPGSRAGHLRLENLARTRTARAEVTDLLVLAGRLLRVAGPAVLVDALRPLGYAHCGFDQIPQGSRTLAREALIRTTMLHGG
jgi:hypothetical protein